MIRAQHGLAAGIIVAWAASLALGQAADAPKKAKQQTPPQVAQFAKQVETLGLTSDQKTKVDEVLKAFTAKIRAAQKATTEVLTPEQVTARGEANRKAKSEGKKGKELADAVAAAANVTPDQQKKLDEASKAVRENVAAMRKAVDELLTAEQRTKLGGSTAKKKSK